MHTLLMLMQRTLFLVCLATVWTYVSLGDMVPAPMLHQILKMQKLFIAVTTLMPLVSLHVSLQCTFIHFFVALWTPDHGGSCIVRQTMLLEILLFSKSFSTDITCELGMALQMLG